MRLLDNPLNQHEIDFIVSMMHGEIVRLCVSDDPSEIIIHLTSLSANAGLLAQSRMIKIKSDNGGE